MLIGQYIELQQGGRSGRIAKEYAGLARMRPMGEKETARGQLERSKVSTRDT